MANPTLAVDSELLPVRSGARSRLVQHRLALSLPALAMASAVWLLWSAVTVGLPGLAGTPQLALALPAVALAAGGLSGLALPSLAQMLGGGRALLVATLLIVLPSAATGIALEPPVASYAVLFALAALTGLAAGGQVVAAPALLGLRVARHEAGTMLGIQEGAALLGIGLVQLVAPILMAGGLAADTAATYRNLDAAGQVTLRAASLAPQHAFLAGVAPLALAVVLLLYSLRTYAGRRAVPVQWAWDAPSRVAFLLHAITFGAFCGMAATAPQLANESVDHYGPVHDALAYVWIAPLLGALARATGGMAADRFGGHAIASGSLGAIALASAALALAVALRAGLGAFLAALIVLFVAAGAGSAATFKLIATRLPSAAMLRGLALASSVAVLTVGAAIPVAVGASFAWTGSPTPALWCLAALAGAGWLLHGWHRVALPQGAPPS